MRTCHAVCSAAIMLVACGCTAPQATTRGQSPHHGQTSVIPASHGNLATTQYPAHDAHAYSTSYHSTSGFPGYDGAMGCPQGPCGNGCGHGCGHGCPHNYHSYSYSRPSDLVYPAAGTPGGAIVYPYYTHKGPSDFFRDDPKCKR
ncbi:MAG: hypothetical protein KF861_17270 [Planctomycetaceae bacterium]|nr:hypothetical protein [Planctomycetaceae bacterium]